MTEMKKLFCLPHFDVGLVSVVWLTGSTKSFVDYWCARQLVRLSSIGSPRMPICVHIGTMLARELFPTNCTANEWQLLENEPRKIKLV